MQLARWYETLVAVHEVSPGTAVRHFNVMHHMMKKAATIWTKDTAIDRNPADQVEIKRPAVLPKEGAKGERQRVEGSFEDLLERANIHDFRFHYLRHTVASWYMVL